MTVCDLGSGARCPISLQCSYVYVRGVRLLRTLDETTVFVASSPMLFGWFESFALQNLQAFSKYEVTNVNIHILL